MGTERISDSSEKNTIFISVGAEFEAPAAVSGDLRKLAAAWARLLHSVKAGIMVTIDAVLAHNAKMQPCSNIP